MDNFFDSSCSAVLNGEFYILGDPSNMTDYWRSHNLIKKITNCGMQSLGEMPFDFDRYEASCGTFHFPDERIFICFTNHPWPDHKTCRRLVESYLL